MKFGVFGKSEVEFNFGSSEHPIIHDDLAREIKRANYENTDFIEDLKRGIDVAYGECQRDSWEWYKKVNKEDLPKIIKKTYESPNYPKLSLKPTHVYGYRCFDMRNNVFF